jgi:flagellar M-ring protein FliF
VFSIPSLGLRGRCFLNFRADMNPFLQQIQQLWNRQSFLGRLVLGGATAILVLIVAGVGFWSSQTSYVVLYSGLPMEEAAAITHKLDADRVTYKLSSDGTAIMVPTESLHKTRMDLARAGVQRNSVEGFEGLKQIPVTASPDYVQKYYAHAVEGELTRTIMTLDSVAHARVHIVQPDPSPFVREQKPVTASVVLKLRPGAVINREGIQAIVALLAGSVTGLTRDNVTIVDTEGRMLSEKKRSTQGQSSSDQLSHQLEVETHLAEKAQEVLNKVLGPDRAVVRVTLDMSFRHVKENSEKFDPDGKVVVHESVQSSKTTAPGGPRGPAGTASNLPPGAPIGPPVAGPSANEEVIDSQYLVSRNGRILEEQQETINRLTVAVMLIPPIPVDEMPLEESLGITPEKAESLVKQAVGFKEGRDKIEVGIGKPVESPAEKALDQQLLAVQNWQSYGTVAKASSLGIAALALLAIGVMSIRTKSAPPPTAGALASGSGAAGDLNDLHAIAGTIKAWLEEPATIRMDRAKSTPTAAAR